MTAYRQKVLRDFWQERTRAFLVVLAIALGISALSAVLSSYAILVRELDEGYLATNPASATLRTDAVDDALLRAVASHPSLSAAEARRAVTGRIKAGPAEWRNLQLFVVKDYANIRVSTLKPQEGAWPPATGEILIERDALQVARARIGDAVTVTTARGSEKTLRVSGSVHDVGQAQARMENVVYGYVTLDTLAQLGEDPYLDQLKVVVAGNTFDEGHVRSVAADLKTWVEGRGHPVVRMDVPKPGKHPHSDLMGLLLLLMSSFGLFALVLSGILVVNLLTALMASQVRQIGVMKAIGGTRGKIARIYFGQALLLGIAAFFVAVPVGNLGARALCRYMAVFLNFDITSFSVPIWVYLLDAAVGIVVPLLAAAYPVWKGSEISVREALADFGVPHTTFGRSAFDRALTRLGTTGNARPILLALRNSFRRRARLALTLLTLSVAGLFFMAALNIRASMIRTLDRFFDSKKFDLTVRLGSMYPFETLERAVRKTPGVLRAEGWIATEASVPSSREAPASGDASGSHAPGSAGLHGGGRQDGNRFSVIALPAETSFLDLQILEGRGLAAGDVNAMVVNGRLAADEPLLKVGSEVKLRMGPSEVSWLVAGRVREPFSPPTAYIPKAYFDQFGGHAGMANSLRLALDRIDPASMTAVRESLDRNLEQEDVRALGSASKAESRFSFDQHMVMIYLFLIVMSSILIGVGGLGLTTTMSLNVLERRRELGVLRAVGASPRIVWLIVVAEGVVVGSMSWALAALAAWPASKVVGDALVTAMFRSGLDFVFEPRGLLIWLAVSLVLGAVASVLPAWRATRLTVREALAYE